MRFEEGRRVFAKFAAKGMPLRSIAYAHFVSFPYCKAENGKNALLFYSFAPLQCENNVDIYICIDFRILDVASR